VVTSTLTLIWKLPVFFRGSEPTFTTNRKSEERSNNMSKSKKKIKVRDIKPKKDAKGGGPKSTLPVTSPSGGGNTPPISGQGPN